MSETKDGGRSDLQIIAKLARQPGWFEELPDQIRRGVMGKLLGVLNKQDLKTRELVSVAKVLGSLEKNDIERSKLLIKVVVEESDEDDA